MLQWTTRLSTIDGDLVKVDILVNGEKVDALACIVHRSQSVARGRALIKKLKELLPRQMFKNCNSGLNWCKGYRARDHLCNEKRRNSKMLRWRCYPKKKLLEKQKEGKKREVDSSVDIPQKAFLAILKLDD